MQKQRKISNETYKGTIDWLPEEFQIRSYIFSKWRGVCEKYGYHEYLTPLLEFADIYKQKSGEDIGGKELYILKDKANRELAIRPEMTPSVTRMITKYYESAPKPLKLFSIANFMRAEKPQRGRNREFWQLNYDVFGSSSILADVEILQMAIEIMLSFNPPQGSFTLKINNRKLINDLVTRIAGNDSAVTMQVVRLLDKWQKLEASYIKEALLNLNIDENSILEINSFMNAATADELIQALPWIGSTEGFTEVETIIAQLSTAGYSEYVAFTPNIIRGFDYYDGMVFEMFDNHPDNNRALFGGGRYNGLADIFGHDNIPAVGCAPGDETMRIFLESWNLLDQVSKSQPKKYYIPILDMSLVPQINKVARSLRDAGEIVEVGFKTEPFSKAIKSADKKGHQYVIIIGDRETANSSYSMKNLNTGDQVEVPFSYIK